MRASNPDLAARRFCDFVFHEYLVCMASFLRPKNNEQSVSIPKELPILPLRETVAYPFSVLPLSVGIPRSVKLVEDAMQGDNLVGLLLSRDKSVEEPVPGQIHEVGTMARILRVVRGQDGNLQVVPPVGFGHIFDLNDRGHLFSCRFASSAVISL